MSEKKILNIVENPKELNEILKDEYEFDSADANNFSFWYNKIKDVKGFIVPNSRIVQIPFKIYNIFKCDDVQNGYNKIKDFVEKNIVPIMKENGNNRTKYFVKNGTFSNKFDYSTCVASATQVVDSFIDICYGAECLGARGNTEFVIRDYIDYDNRRYATIYNGLPLRCEIRVFYDFEKRKLLYAVDYWNYDYIIPHLYSKTDKIIFEAVKDELRMEYKRYKKLICEKVEESFKTIDLRGKWSIDIMIDDLDGRNDYYLIDMALAETSAYWDETKNDGN